MCASTVVLNKLFFCSASRFLVFQRRCLYFFSLNLACLSFLFPFINFKNVTACVLTPLSLSSLLLISAFFFLFCSFYHRHKQNQTKSCLNQNLTKLFSSPRSPSTRVTPINFVIVSPTLSLMHALRKIHSLKLRARLAPRLAWS